MMKSLRNKTGFTIVELLIVVVVIAILAAIVIVAYNGVTRTAKETALKTDLKTGATQLSLFNIDGNNYPTTVDDLKKSQDTEYSYRYNNVNRTFCLSATSSQLPGAVYHITEQGALTSGVCPAVGIQNGDLIQTVTTANCPATRTMVVDARDTKTYWIQRLADNRCWMLTNLSYAGGGANTYSDVKVIQDGTADSTWTYTAPKYYIHANANATVSPTNPSVSTDGGATNAQWGYFYNWCAAMGAQTSTSACANATTPSPNSTISVCPANWRLPSGGSGGELSVFTSAAGIPNNSTGASTLRSLWLSQLTGHWANCFSAAQNYAYYWSNTQVSAILANHMGSGSGNVNPLGDASKNTAFSVRCIAS